MGWWKIEGTQSVVGDAALDTLGDAVAEVVSAYQSAFNRRPTGAEWEALLVAVLGAKEPEAQVSEDGVVRRVLLELGDRP